MGGLIEVLLYSIDCFIDIAHECMLIDLLIGLEVEKTHAMLRQWNDDNVMKSINIFALRYS